MTSSVLIKNNIIHYFYFLLQKKLRLVGAFCYFFLAAFFLAAGFFLATFFTVFLQLFLQLFFAAFFAFFTAMYKVLKIKSNATMTYIIYFASIARVFFVFVYFFVCRLYTIFLKILINFLCLRYDRYKAIYYNYFTIIKRMLLFLLKNKFFIFSLRFSKKIKENVLASQKKYDTMMMFYSMTSFYEKIYSCFAIKW